YSSMEEVVEIHIPILLGHKGIGGHTAEYVSLELQILGTVDLPFYGRFFFNLDIRTVPFILILVHVNEHPGNPTPLFHQNPWVLLRAYLFIICSGSLQGQYCGVFQATVSTHRDPFTGNGLKV